MSCAGNGYLSGNMLVAFPFEDGQLFAWEDHGASDELQQAIQACFVDACISVRGDVSEGWPSIGCFSSDGDTLSFVLSACGNEVPVSVSGSSKDAFPIVSGSEPWGSYAIVLSADGISSFCNISPPARNFSRSSPAGEEGSLLRLCAKCVTVMPEILRSIMVYDGKHGMEDGPHFVIEGDVVVRSGNNMRLGEDDDDPAAIELNAEPGAGLGVVECACEDEGVEGSVLIAGKDGHSRFFNDTCYDLEPNTTTGELKMHAKCTACCTCQMYESVVNEKLASLAESVRKARKGISDMLQTYETAVSAFNERISRPDLSDVSLTLSGMPIGKNVSPKIVNPKVKGKMGRCVFTATISNSSFFEVTAKIGSVTSSGSVVEASAAWSDSGGAPLSRSGDGASAVTGSYVIFPGRSLVITFIAVKNDMVSNVSTGGYSGSVSSEISWSGGVLGTLSKTVSV